MFLPFILIAANMLNIQTYLSKVKGFDTLSYFKFEVYADNKNLNTVKEAEGMVDAQNFNLHLMNWCLFAATQEMRQLNNIPSQKFSEALRNAAVIHSNEMVEKNFYSHINTKNLALKTPEDRMALCGIQSAQIAENIHDFGFKNKSISYKDLAKGVVKSFYDSPNHKRNMLDKKLNNLGCGALCYKGKQGGELYFLKVTECFAALAN